MAPANISTLSDKGDATLVDEEGDVLRAYRCPAGTWTIGVGLTAASGVVKPKAGMVITSEESRRLRRLALARNYEPLVAKALPTGKQNVFDGGLLFHWNTGAIARASWVKLFLQGAVQKARVSFMSWNRAGGKIMPGLSARRGREWNIIEFANYGAVKAVPASVSPFSDYVLDFQAFGYDTAKGAVTTVTAFQRDQKLTVDGVIGPATRAAIARVKAARSTNGLAKGAVPAGAVVGAGGDVSTDPGGAASIDLHSLLWVAGSIAVLLALVYGLSLAWRFRGPLFAWLPEPVKDWFEAMGIVLGRRVRT